MKYTLLIISLLVAITAFPKDKKVLTYDEMLSWHNIKNSTITNDGTYVIYEVGPLVGDNQIIVYEIKNQQADTLNLASGFKVSPDGHFLIATQKVPHQEMRQAKLDELKKDEMPKDSTIIFNFLTKQTLVLPKADSALVAKKEGFLAGILFKPEKEKEETKDSTEIQPEIEEETPEASENEEEVVTTDSISSPKPMGKTLIIYNGETGDTTQVHSVKEFTISAKENQIAFIDSYELDTITTSTCMVWKDGTPSNIYKTEGEIKKLRFNENGSHLAFIGSKDTSKVKTYSLLFSQDGQEASVAINSEKEGLPSNWAVSENGNIQFSENGKYLYMGTAEIQEEEPKDTLTDDEKPKLDVWSWTDTRLQPEQLIKAKKDKKKTYLAVWNIAEDKLIQIEDETFSSSTLTDKKNATTALIENESPYIRESNWTGLWKKDLALINLETGQKKEISKAQFRFRLSEAAKYVFWYSDIDTCYYTYSVETGKTVNISKDIDTKIYNELEDHPIIPGTYGNAGWTVNDEYVLVYDRYDIWKVDPTGKQEPVNITNGYGRQNNISLRVVDLDKENEFVDFEETMLLKGTNEETNSNYFYEFKPGKKTPLNLLLEGDYRFSSPTKAKNANTVIWSKQNFATYPDLMVSDTKFKKQQTITHVNPQQTEYNWGQVETYSWTSFRGEKLNGLIYKPENFDASEKYPMIVYYYERSFSRQHTHRIPSPSRSTINPTFYASNGYLVFIPDITYIDGYPGQSAYDCVVSGVQSLTTQFPWINEEKIGLQGQSWGGYQTAYLITRTDMFAAAMGGAVVSNMTSAYGGIRWKTGLNRMFQYEKTQSRIGGTLWDKPMQYIENSPLFYAPKVNTPILLMHNDNDGAVPWYQGIEFFVALRRLDKPVWMLNYNGQPHNLSGTAVANRMDLSKRMKQFFDHYLKGDEAPEWMLKGIPAIEKGKNLGY